MSYASLSSSDGSSTSEGSTEDFLQGRETPSLTRFSSPFMSITKIKATERHERFVTRGSLAPNIAADLEQLIASVNVRHHALEQFALGAGLMGVTAGSAAGEALLNDIRGIETRVEFACNNALELVMLYNALPTYQGQHQFRFTLVRQMFQTSWRFFSTAALSVAMAIVAKAPMKYPSGAKRAYEELKPEDKEKRLANLNYAAMRWHNQFVRLLELIITVQCMGEFMYASTTADGTGPTMWAEYVESDQGLLATQCKVVMLEYMRLCGMFAPLEMDYSWVQINSHFSTVRALLQKINLKVVSRLISVRTPMDAFEEALETDLVAEENGLSFSGVTSLLSSSSSFDAPMNTATPTRAATAAFIQQYSPPVVDKSGVNNFSYDLLQMRKELSGLVNGLIKVVHDIPSMVTSINQQHRRMDKASRPVKPKELLITQFTGIPSMKSKPTSSTSSSVSSGSSTSSDVGDDDDGRDYISAPPMPARPVPLPATMPTTPTILRPETPYVHDPNSLVDVFFQGPFTPLSLSQTPLQEFDDTYRYG